MYEHGSLPRARQEGLLEETVGEELLLYDQNSHTAHCLSPIAACVWRHCDGERDLAALAVVAGVSENLVADALHELREKDLLDAEPELMQSTIPGESRREAIGRVARYGAAAAAGSMIVSATAATPAMASSSGFEEDAKGWECKKTPGFSCCRCDKGDACGNVGVNEASCKQECEKVFGANSFFSWTPEAKCTPL
jgi:hypothetical protein